MTTPVLADYQPGGKYYKSVTDTLDGNKQCAPLTFAYPVSENLQNTAGRIPYFKALVEEIKRRVGDSNES